MSKKSLSDWISGGGVGTSVPGATVPPLLPLPPEPLAPSSPGAVAWREARPQDSLPNPIPSETPTRVNVMASTSDLNAICEKLAALGFRELYRNCRGDQARSVFEALGRPEGAGLPIRHERGRRPGGA